MNTQSPAEVLHALASGVDPASGEKLDVCGIWRQAVIADALPEIATRHQRSLTAIEARLERLGKITAEQRVTRNRFTAA